MTDLTVDELEDSVKAEKIFNNAVILANIIELTTNVIADIAGKDISDVIEKDGLNKTILARMTSNRIKEKILNEDKL